MSFGQQGMEITMDDGGDYTARPIALRNIVFNVLENGQPRWQACQHKSSTSISGTFSLLPYLPTQTHKVIRLSGSIDAQHYVKIHKDVFTVELDGTTL